MNSFLRLICLIGAFTALSDAFIIRDGAVRLSLTQNTIPRLPSYSTTRERRKREHRHQHQQETQTLFSSSSQIDEQIKLNNVKPRTGIAQSLLDFALSSPLWKLVLVPQARKNIVKTAQENGIKWTDAYTWFIRQEGPWKNDEIPNNDYIEGGEYPEFFTKEFHAYAEGNLCWESAIEQEIASRAVGARNFPSYGYNGEDAFREAFESALLSLGAAVPQNGVVVDLGCGTGTSTRRLASSFPQAEKVTGIDLSPYFIEVGKFLLKNAPKGQNEGGPWVTTIENDRRVELCVGNAQSTGLQDKSVDVVNLGLVIHELPMSITCQIIEEALRILKPNGQLWVSEMDYDSPAFAEQRSNALLFSLIRSTEPYLDEYADGFPEILNCLVKNFQSVKITAATGRHFALIATKGDDNGTNQTDKCIFEDKRFDKDGKYVVDDTHLKTWETKKK